MFRGFENRFRIRILFAGQRNVENQNLKETFWLLNTFAPLQLTPVVLGRRNGNADARRYISPSGFFILNLPNFPTRNSAT
jgi:hypothetical protein